MNSPHRRGKIARLPQNLRDLVNRLLADGAEYKQIIAELEKRRDQWPPGITSFNKTNITQWRIGGYKEWLAENQLREERRAERQETLDLLRQQGSYGFERAARDLAKVQLFNVLYRTDTRGLSELLEHDPEQFTRMLNSLSKFHKSW